MIRKKSRASFYAAVYAVLAFAAGLHAESGDGERELNREIAERKKELQRLQSERERLESSVEQKNKSLGGIDVQLQRYEINLESSRKESDEFKQRLTEIRTELEQKLAILNAGFSAAQPRLGESEILGRGRHMNATAMAREVYGDLTRRQAEERTVHELLQAALQYQQRIINKYMPNEQAIKESLEERLTQDTGKLADRTQRQIVISAELKRLQDRARALDQALRTIDRRETEKQERRSHGNVKSGAFVPGTAFTNLEGRLSPPVTGQILRGFGPYKLPDSEVTIQILGLDIETAGDAPVRAVADGQVLFTGFLPEYGDIVALNHGDGYVTVYGNVVSQELHQDQLIKAGQLLGAVEETRTLGATARSILHFEIRKNNEAIDPMPWLGSDLKAFEVSEGTKP